MIDTAVIIPSLNPDEKLLKTIKGLESEGFSNFVLVDDGSDAAHKAPFEEAMAVPGCRVLVHDVNKGKGCALKTAFSYVLGSMPFINGVITVDGDGQHSPDDVRHIAEVMKEKPYKVIIGCRDFRGRDVPMHNRLGNRITSGVFSLLCGIKLSDTQTGLRGIPRSCLEGFIKDVEGERFEYETNMLLYMKKEGIEFDEVPIRTLYIEENKTSHFRVFRDSAKIYRPILKFGAGSLLSVLIDLVLFTVLNMAVFKGLGSEKLREALAVICARIVSSLFNFTYNKTVVFKKKGGVKKSVARYYVLVAVQLALSTVLVLLLTGVTGAEGFGQTLVKLVVDSVHVIVSFCVQRAWVFKE